MEETRILDNNIGYFSSEDEDEDSFISCLSDVTTELPIDQLYPYIELIFDPERCGFVDIAENIVQYLDYHSLINFKKTCQKVYNFFKWLPYVEKAKLEKKLDRDWRLGEPKKYTIQTPGLVSCAAVFPDSRKIVIGIDHVVQVVDVRTGIEYDKINKLIVLIFIHIMLIENYLSMHKLLLHKQENLITF